MRSPFLHEWMFAHAERRPEAAAVDSPTVRLTYGELAARTRALAGHLFEHGVRPGDRVLLALPNVVATVVAGLAIQMVGATSVEVNRAWGAEILARIVAQSGVRHAITWWRDARVWESVAARSPLEHAWEVRPGPLPEAPSAARRGWILDDGRVDPRLGEPLPPPSPSLRPESLALILYTSGSTGVPRGVLQTFRNVNANARSIVQYLGLSPADRALVVLPLYYCYGRSILQTHLLAGGSIFLDERTAFPRVILETLASEACTGFAGVPLTYEIFRRQVDVASIRFEHLRYLTQAGGAMAPDTIAWTRKAFAPARLFVMYGQTEATARLSYLPPERAEEKAGSIGIPIPGVELKVVDDLGRELPAGDVGHLVARGDNVTLGYLDEPEETAAILRDGWLWTGDLARGDTDGFLFHEGRSKEILKIGGHRVSPTEIEHVVARHPGVAEAAVIGEAHALLGEVAVAFVVSRTGCEPSDDALRRHCQELLPAYKVPVRFERVDGLPRSPAGKLLRAQLPGSRV